jgi:hypothetical protein
MAITLKTKKNKLWTKREDNKLTDLYKTHSRKQLSIALKRTEGSIRSRLWKYGLNEKKSELWSENDLDKLRVAYDSASLNRDINLDKLAEDLGRLKSNICRKAKELGFTDIRRKSINPEECKRRRKYTDEERAKRTSIRTKLYFSTNGHPKGMLGKNHSKETKDKISIWHTEYAKNLSADIRDEITLKQRLTREKNGTQQNMNRANASWGAGWREIGGINKYYRSKWEANYARYLEWLKYKGQIKSWRHESKTFWFEGIKRGCLSYLPDFEVIENDGKIVYHEVKGWMDERSITKIKRMAIYHPNVKLIVIDSKCYKSLKKTMMPIIHDWETNAKHG